MATFYRTIAQRMTSLYACLTLRACHPCECDMWPYMPGWIPRLTQVNQEITVNVFRSRKNVILLCVASMKTVLSLSKCLTYWSFRFMVCCSVRRKESLAFRLCHSWNMDHPECCHRLSTNCIVTTIIKWGKHSKLPKKYNVVLLDRCTCTEKGVFVFIQVSVVRCLCEWKGYFTQLNVSGSVVVHRWCTDILCQRVGCQDESVATDYAQYLQQPMQQRK